MQTADDIIAADEGSNADSVRAVIITTPITVSIGPIPEKITALNEIVSFGIRGFATLVNDFGLAEIASYDVRGMKISYAQDASNIVTIRGDRTAISVRRAEREGNVVSLSQDNGQTFTETATFSNDDLAAEYVNAWINGLV